MAQPALLEAAGRERSTSDAAAEPLAHSRVAADPTRLPPYAVAVQRSGEEVEPAGSPLEAEADQVARDTVGQAPSDRPAETGPPPTAEVAADESADGLPTDTSIVSPPGGAAEPPGEPGPAPSTASGPASVAEGAASPTASPTPPESASTGANGDSGPPVQASREPEPGHPAGGPALASGIEAARPGGDPLPGAVRDDFEPRLGVDLSSVRVHTGPAADRLSSAIDARAFTSGSDIFFRAGHYRPEATRGRSLLAHELTHVAQQGGAGATALGPRTAALTPRYARSPLGPQRQPDPPGASPGGSSGAPSGVAYVGYTAFVPTTCTSFEQAYRIFERVAYGRETNSTGWKPGSYTDISQLQGKQIRFKVPRANVPELNDPDLIKARDDAKKQLGGESPAGRQAIVDEADRRYRKETGDPSGKKIASGDEGRSLQWDRKLQDVLADGKKLDELPDAVKRLLVGKKPMTPAAYERLLLIAKKLEGLSPEDLAAFSWLTVRATDNLDLFEKAVDLFLQRKADIVKAYEAQQGQPQQAAPKDDLRAAFDKKWQGLDEGAIATMSEEERYDLAERKTAEMTNAQLKFMAEHPGATLADFAKSATLVNTPETFKAIGGDLTEAADADANSWARFAAGTGAGAKLSGWVLAVAGVLYAASWLTGIGELATIGAVAGYALAATITLSAVEAELRVKAASQATTAEEFKRNVELAAAARANVIVSIALIVAAAVLHFIGKTFFPKTMARMRTAMLNLRERIRLKGSIFEIKSQITAEMGANRAEVVKACEAAKQQAAATAKELSGLDVDAFADRLESGNGDFLDQTNAPPENRVNYKELTKTPEGRAALEQYRQALIDSLTKDVPAQIDALQADYTGKIDKFLAEVEAAVNHEQLGQAVDGFDPTLSEEHLKTLMSGAQDALVKQKLADAAKQLDQQLQPPAGPAAKSGADQTTPPSTPSTPPKAPTESAPGAGEQPKPPALEPKPAGTGDEAVPGSGQQPKAPGAEEGKAPAAGQEPAAPAGGEESKAPGTTEPPKAAGTPDEAAKPGEPPAPPLTQEQIDAQAKIAKIEAEMAPLQALRAQLKPLIDASLAADAAFKKIELEIHRLNEAASNGEQVDPAQLKELEAQRVAAMRARKQAADALRDFYERNDLDSNLTLEYQLADLAKDIQKIKDALNAKPGVPIDESLPLGGRYYDVPAQGGEVNHMPADSASPYLTRGKGPSIRMDTLDHYQTSSWGSGKKAVAWRARQEALIRGGKFMEALEMDIAEVRSKFGSKYEKGIQQLLDYVATSGDIKALSKNSTVTVGSLRAPAGPVPVAPAP